MTARQSGRKSGKAPAPKRVHLALQGGGAYGAFTWGALDALLQDPRITFAGISGTSAGALNAVAVAHGWACAEAGAADPAEEARVALAHIWRRVMGWGAMGGGLSHMGRLMLGALPSSWTHVSPYQVNPLDYNPLRELLVEVIDFGRLAKLASPRVFVTATEVQTGRAEVFSGARLSAEAVIASCCLPQLFRAPEINGKSYWDGGYASNPALGPLIEMGETDDILLIQINPLRRQGKPMTSAAIADRVNDLTFGASLIAQMRTVALVNDLIEHGAAPPGARTIRMHRIGGGPTLDDLPPKAKTVPQPVTVEKLFDRGSAAAKRWLRRHLGSVGHKSSINIARDYGNPLQLDFGTSEPESDDADMA